MNQTKNTILIIIVSIAVLGFGFYWFELRPAQIRKRCYADAKIIAKSAIEVESRMIAITKRADYDKVLNDWYKNCLLQNGVNY